MTIKSSRKTLSKFILKLATISIIFQRNQSESNNSKNKNSINDNYSNILPDKGFNNEHINPNDPNKTAFDNDITINSVEQHLPAFCQHLLVFTSICQHLPDLQQIARNYAETVPFRKIFTPGN